MGQSTTKLENRNQFDNENGSGTLDTFKLSEKSRLWCIDSSSKVEASIRADTEDDAGDIVSIDAHSRGPHCK